MSGNNTRHGHLIAPERVREFITGGKAIFTIQSTTTSNRGTFRVEKLEGSEHDYEVRAFTGSDNSLKSSYTLMGWVRKDGTFLRYTEAGEFMDLRAAVQTSGKDAWLVGFLDNWAKCKNKGWRVSEKMTKRYGISLRKYGIPEALPTDEKGTLLEKMFAWTWARVHSQHPLPQNIEVWHEGSCCYCAKRLTVPASIELGMGPDCAEEHGFFSLWQSLNENPGQGLAA